jgi:hypothetical protein
MIMPAVSKLKITVNAGVWGIYTINLNHMTCVFMSRNAGIVINNLFA